MENSFNTKKYEFLIDIVIIITFNKNRKRKYLFKYKMILCIILLLSYSNYIKYNNKIILLN